MAIDVLQGKYTNAKLWSPIDEIEYGALTQLKNICGLPWVKHVSVMPDVHFGKGATVGSVIAMKGAVSPAAVGVDIGCGMLAAKTNLTAKDLPESLRKLRLSIEEAVPVGFSSHDTVAGPARSLKLWEDYDNLTSDVTKQGLLSKAMSQIGTLGGGNHFIEVCLDTDDNVWVMLHSGSRNIGLRLAQRHIATAKQLIHNHSAEVVDRDLSVFLANTPEMEAYRHDLYWAQEYALANRAEMFRLLSKVMVEHFPTIRFDDAIQCHHNYVSEETHFGEDLFVTRKGAIRARKGDMGIIPGSMGTKSYIVRGLGSADSLSSASHGAGRVMSRSKAKKTFTLEDFQKQTEGVECRKDKDVIDEIPQSYKDIDQVMANQSDLVEVVAQLKQVLCVKG